MSILIADSGSTKTHWLWFNHHHTPAEIFTQGINPFFQSAEDIAAMLQHELLPKLSSVSVEKIFFYGAGCSQPDKIETVRKALQQTLRSETIEVEHDLLAAARATCGKESGIVCILGTGSNSCAFDGKNITDNIPSLGFLLGDEGSGAWFGRKLLQAYFYRELPSTLKQLFEEKFQPSKDAVLNVVYGQKNPNRYVASFMPFLIENKNHDYIAALLKTGFEEFVCRFVIKYERHKNVPVHFIGSVAFMNQSLLENILHTHELQPGKFLKSPMEGLKNFYSTQHAL